MHRLLNGTKQIYFCSKTDKAYAIIWTMVTERQKGYTILEVLIFIAVSSAMLMMAVAAFSGRQADVEFTQAVRDLESRIQDTINDVSTGYFFNSGKYTCTAGASGVTVVESGLSDKQGESDDCLFIGKAIQFAPSSGNNQMTAFTIVGARKIYSGANAGADVSSVAESKPAVVDGATQTTNLQWGMRITKAFVDTASSPNVGTVGFFSSFSKSIGDSEVSNGQAIKYAAIPSTSIGQTNAQASGRLESTNYSAAGLFSLNNRIKICLQSGGNNKKAVIIIGGSGKTTVESNFTDAETAAC